MGCKVRVEKMLVDVADEECHMRPCFQLGFDKGYFTKGRGYTSYHKKPIPVCMTRHLHGCPENSRCPQCNTVSRLSPGAKCEWCKSGVMIPPQEE